MVAGHQDPDVVNNMHFLHYIQEHGVEFSSTAEFEFRKQLFLQKDAKIKAFNEEQGTEVEYQLGHNQFSILTDEEW